MSKIIHYGKLIDSDVPTTGVINTNEVMWEFMDNDEICLVCDEAIKEHSDHAGNEDFGYSDDCPNCKEGDSYCIDYLECDSSHTRLHGDWILDTNTGLYDYDPQGEFTMIENESTCQIIFSKTIAKGNPCSPCFVGQVEFSKDGDFKAYTLPEELLYKRE